MHIQLDPLGGIAGDMFIAAVLDAMPEWADETFECMRTVCGFNDWPLALIPHNDGTFSGTRFEIEQPRDNSTESHAHRHHADIVRHIFGAPIDPAVRERALAIFRVIAEAEAAVHGISVDKVAFHEVGAWDSIADVIGAAFLIARLSPTSWALGPVPMGGGRIHTAHGPMPVPAPATALLLAGFECIQDGVTGERVTPTGAAILRHLADSLGMPTGFSLGPMTLGRSGTGFGSSELPGISNVCRILTCEPAHAEVASAPVGHIAFEIDDQSPEDLALGIDALRKVEGILDVLQVTAIGKKGRMVCQLQVLCRPDALGRAVEACFAQTSTLGLRWSVVARSALMRETVVTNATKEQVLVKVASRPDGRHTAKAEAESVRHVGGRIERDELRRVAEDDALRPNSADQS